MPSNAGCACLQNVKVEQQVTKEHLKSNLHRKKVVKLKKLRKIFMSFKASLKGGHIIRLTCKMNNQVDS